MDIQLLIDISNNLGLADVSKELEIINLKNNQQDCPITIPLVGEFSSGKTTLINALTDSKVLESATKPTTATIYEIHFGSDKCFAVITNQDGTMEQTSDIQNLKNDTLKDAIAVTLYDTSSKVSPSTILVDTPGLSSQDPKHKQTLVNFLPSADGILLIFDINAQYTRSLDTFIKDMALVKRPIYVIVTMCDTKPFSDRKKVKDLFLSESGNSVRDIAFVSAKENELDELYSILNKIKEEKSTIIHQVNEQRTILIAKRMYEYIDNLLESTKPDSNIDDSIQEQKTELERLQQNIKKLIKDTDIQLQEEKRAITRSFDNIISERLDRIVVGKSNNFDNEVVASINSTVTLLTNDYCSRIRRVLSQKANERLESAESVSLHFLEEIDLSDISISGISYDININSLGHEHDKAFSTGIKIVGTVAAAAAIVFTAGTATGVIGASGASGAAAGASGAAGAAAGVAGGAAQGINFAQGVIAAANVVDVASDVANISSNAKTAKRIQKAVDFANIANKQYVNVEKYDSVIGSQMGCKKGMTESAVGFFTDKKWGKPQRKKAIRTYVDTTLVPQFNREVEKIHCDVLSEIQIRLQQEASNVFAGKKAILEQLKQDRINEKDAFDKKIEQLKEFRSRLTKNL